MSSLCIVIKLTLIKMQFHFFTKVVFFTIIKLLTRLKPSIIIMLSNEITQFDN